MKRIECFFDYTCPYCYRGHQYLMDLLPQYPQAQMEWRPVEAHPREQEPWFTPHADLAVQGAFFLRDQGLPLLPYHQRVYRACFEEGLRVDDIAVLVACAVDVGADGAAFEQALHRGTYRQEQRRANAYAFGSSRVWAVPAFVCGDKRLDAVEDVGITPKQLNGFLKECCG